MRGKPITPELRNGAFQVSCIHNRVIPRLLLLLALPAQTQQALTGKVVGVSDGDTITILADGQRQVKVRLHGIDAPESDSGAPRSAFE